MRGPAGSPYERATLRLSIRFSEAYPQRAPEIRFVAPVLHCNVNSSGKICHTMLDANYCASFSMSTLLHNIVALLGDPEATSPIDSVLGELYRTNRPQYEARARAAAAPFTALTFQECKQQLVEEGGGAGAAGEAAPAAAAGSGGGGGGKRKRAALEAAAAPASSAASALAGAIPRDMLCPITREFFMNACITPSGRHYDYRALADLLQRSPVDPVEGTPLRLEDCTGELSGTRPQRARAAPPPPLAPLTSLSAPRRAAAHAHPRTPRTTADTEKQRAVDKYKEAYLQRLT